MPYLLHSLGSNDSCLMGNEQWNLWDAVLKSDGPATLTPTNRDSNMKRLNFPDRH